MPRLESPVLPLSLAVLFLVASSASAIVRRHDVDDSDYVVDASEYPAVVDLFPRDPGDCIATLIAPRWLITAAHCAEDLGMSDELVVGGRSHGLTRIDNHEGWNQDTDDITLIQIDAASEVTPIPWYIDQDEVGQVVWFVGRGDTSTGQTGGGRVDGNTRAATNTVIAADRHWIEFEFNSPEDPGVTPLEGISGDGDSGGPALIETDTGLRIAGLSSFQDNGRQTLGTYGVREFYTRVSSYRDWIEERTGPLPEPAVQEGADGEPTEAADPVAESDLPAETGGAEGAVDAGGTGEDSVARDGEAAEDFGNSAGAAPVASKDDAGPLPMEGATAASATSCGVGRPGSPGCPWLFLLLLAVGFKSWRPHPARDSRASAGGSVAAWGCRQNAGCSDAGAPGSRQISPGGERGCARWR